MKKNVLIVLLAICIPFAIIAQKGKANKGDIEAGDRIKVGKEYKIGVVVSVNVADLRKYLESENIIKSLSSGF